MNPTTKRILGALTAVLSAIAGAAIYDSRLATGAFWGGVWEQVVPLAHEVWRDGWPGILVICFISGVALLSNVLNRRASAEPPTPPPTTKAELANAKAKREMERLRMTPKEREAEDARLAALKGYRDDLEQTYITGGIGSHVIKNESSLAELISPKPQGPVSPQIGALLSGIGADPPMPPQNSLQGSLERQLSQLGFLHAPLKQTGEGKDGWSWAKQTGEFRWDYPEMSATDRSDTGRLKPHILEKLKEKS